MFHSIFGIFLVQKNGYQKSTKKLGLPDPPYFGLSPKKTIFCPPSLNQMTLVLHNQGWRFPLNSCTTCANKNVSKM